MTSISRRSFLAVAAASGAAALSNTVSAQEKPSVSEKFKDYPAGAKSAAKYPALPEPLPDLSHRDFLSRKISAKRRIMHYGMSLGHRPSSGSRRKNGGTSPV